MKLNISALSGKKKYFSRRFMLFLSVPIIIATIFTYIGNIYYSNHYREMSLSVCSNEFNRFLQETEDIISDIAGHVSTLTSISETKIVSSGTCTPESIDPNTTRALQEAILNLSTQMPVLDNIMIINRNNNFVVCSTGVYELYNYFNTVYSYSEYTAEYWLSYPFRARGYEMLPADNVFHSNFDGNVPAIPVVPVVFPAVSTDSSSLVVCNINSQLIYEDFQSYRFTDNSEQYMINTSTGEALSNLYENSTVNSDAVKQMSTTNYYSLGNLKEDHEKYYVISSLPRSNTFGYNYIVKIPYSDIQNQTHQTFAKIMLLGMLLILFMLIYTYIGSKRLSKPWLTLANKLGELGEKNVPSTGDIISDIDEAITHLINKNTGLERNLAVTLPHSQQKYLADILNNPASVPDEEMNGLIFKHEYFISVAINLSLKQAFPSSSIILNEHLYNEVYKALESVFATNFLTFSLVGTNNTLYLILNVDTDDCTEMLSSVNQQLKILLSADTDYIDMYIGIGNVYKGIDGLRLSHQEALSNIFKDMNEDKIQIFDNNNLSNYSLSVYNENILVNHILAGHGEEASEFVKNIFTSCSKKSSDVKKQIYTDLFKALYKAINIKKIRVPDFQSKSEQEIAESILSYSENEILTYFTNLISNVTNLEVQASKSTAATIVAYIEEHYNEELYLDNMAEKFNTTPKYLSKMLGQHLGIPFKSYLTQLRISKAEEMLLDKSLKINDISREVGFLNQSSFIRAFKLKNGISPSEYRSLHTKK